MCWPASIWCTKPTTPSSSATSKPVGPSGAKRRPKNQPTSWFLYGRVLREMSRSMSKPVQGEFVVLTKQKTVQLQILSVPITGEGIRRTQDGHRHHMAGGPGRQLLSQPLADELHHTASTRASARPSAATDSSITLNLTTSALIRRRRETLCLHTANKRPA